MTGNDGVYSLLLSSEAITDINAAIGGTIILGFTNLTLNSEDPTGVGLGIYINGNTGYAGLSPVLRVNASAPVPEPATMLLLASGLAGLAGVRRRFKK